MLHVYFSTSSIVVSPAKMLRKPSWRSVIIPSSIAFCLIVTVGARSLINSRIGSVILQQLVNSFSSFVAGVVTRVATLAVEELFVADVAARDTELSQ